MRKQVLKHVKDDSCKVQYRVCGVPNPKGGNACYAGRAVMKKASLRSIAEQMEREGSKYAQHEILGIAEQMIDVIIDRLRHGETVDFGSMMRIRPSIKGRFESEMDKFDDTRHELEVVVTAGSQLRKALEGVSAEKIGVLSYPEIKSAELIQGEDVTIVYIRGRRLHRTDLGTGAQWTLTIDGKTINVKPLLQKLNGRYVTFSFTSEQLPIGVAATLTLKLSNNYETSIQLPLV